MSIGWIKTGLKIATFKQIKKFIIYLLLWLVLYDLYNDKRHTRFEQKIGLQKSLSFFFNYLSSARIDWSNWKINMFITLEQVIFEIVGDE